MKHIILIAGLSLAGAATVHAAPAFPIAADGTTNVADCAKAPAASRNDCISRARPLTGKEIYAKAAAKPTVAVASTAVEKAKRRAAEKAARLAAIKYNKARVASAPKGLKVNGDGTTNIADCGSVKPQLRNECIGRARPLSVAALASFSKQRQAAYEKSAALNAKRQAAKDAVAKKLAAVKKAVVDKVAAVAPTKVGKTVPVSVASLAGKGFAVDKNGTTNIADCAKAKPEFKNECISRSRPLTGAEIYSKARPRS
jgi:hypothetical protein